MTFIVFIYTSRQNHRKQSNRSRHQTPPRSGAACWRVTLSRRPAASPLPGRLSSSMTSFSKPEVLHTLSQRRQRRTEPRPRVTRSENLVTFEHVILDVCEQKDRQTNSPQYSAAIPRGGLIRRKMDGRPQLFHDLPLPRLLHRYQIILLGDRGTWV